MLLWSHKISEEDIESFQGADIYCMPNTISFVSLDGTLRFAMSVINYELSLGVNRDTRLILNKINRYLSKLLLVNTEYLEGSDYKEYCKRMSRLLKVPTDYKEINSNKGKFSKMFKERPEKNIIFVIRSNVYYKGKREIEEVEDFKLYVEQELLNQMQGFNISVNTLPGSFMTEYDCHVELLVGIRYIWSALLRLCNTREKYSENGLMFYDLLEINQRLEMFELTLKRIENL